MILGIICTIVSIVGLCGLFVGNTILVIIGGVAGIIETLVGIISGEQKSLVTSILAIIIGIIYAIFSGTALWLGVFIGLCFESVIMGVLSWGLIGISMIANKKAGL
jgi:hypothetical protein